MKLNKISKYIPLLMIMFLAGCESAIRIKNITSLPAIIPNSHESKPVMLAKVVVKLPRGQVIGSLQGGWMCVPQGQLYWKGGRVNFDTEELSEVLRDEFEKNGYTVVGDSNALFEDETQWKAEFLIGALIKNIATNICYPNAGFGNFSDCSGEMYMDVEWQIKSRRTRDVVLKLETEGSSFVKQSMPMGQVEVFNRAFAQATNNLLADRKFFELVAYDKDIPERKKIDKNFEPVKIKFKNVTDSDVKGKFTKDNMVQQIRNATVTIYAGNAHGSGWIISEDGFVLTNAHVVGEANFVQIKLVTGSERTGEVIRKDKERDVALIKLEEGLYPFAVIGNSASLKISDEVYAIGTPREEEYSQTVSKGIVSSFRVEDDVRYIQSDVNVQPGNSGGPLVSPEFGVIGITVQGLSGLDIIGNRLGIGLNYFIPVEEAIDVLKIEKIEK